MVWEEPMVTNTDKSFESDSFKELQLLQSWFSPSFPIGSYSYSHGLESLIEEKIIQNKSDVIEYLTGIIFNGTCKNDVIFIKCTYEGLELNDYLMALCASKERKIETLALALDCSREMPLSLIGGLAKPLLPYLPVLLQDWIQDPIGDPISGALMLAKGLVPEENINTGEP